jgi:two-component system OmpR family response regulator
MRLLLIDSAASSVGSLSGALRRSGHIVDVFQNSGEAALAVRAAEYDLLLFELSSSSAKVLSLLRSLRARADHTPALVVVAGASLAERVRILDMGADDCMAGPCALVELEARMRAVMRRALGGCGDNLIGLGRLRFDLAGRSARVGEARLHLSPREIDLLETLILKRGRVVSKAQIRGRLCGWSGDLSDGAIELYVHRLRRRLAGTGINLRTVRGFGYMMQQGAPG